MVLTLVKEVVTKKKKHSPEQAISMILYYHVYLDADYYFID